MRKTWIAALIVSATLLCGCGWSTYPDPSDPVDVAQAFAYAMIDHDADRARKFVIPEWQPKAESWLASHPKYNCPFTLDMDDNVLSGVGAGGKEAGILHMTYWFHCIGYRLTIDDIKVLPAGNIWMITEWKQICEEFGYSEQVGYRKDCDPPEK